jgi:heterotetrameric sarcosine oxidase gamma subunit
MIQRGSVIVIEVAITQLPATPLHAMEIWSNPSDVAARFAAAMGFALPPMGRSAGNDRLGLIRFEPTVWLAEGDVSGLGAILGDDGALTAIGGGVVRVRLSGAGWRALLMEGGVFDAEDPSFAPGCSAATIIDHVNVRLHVVADDACIAYVPASYTADLLHFWNVAGQTLTA